MGRKKGGRKTEDGGANNPQSGSSQQQQQQQQGGHPPQQQPRRGPQPQEQQRGPQQQPGSPAPQWGPPLQQQPQRGPQPQEQQKGPQHQRKQKGLQQQRGPEQQQSQQQRGPQQQQPQQQRGPQQQQPQQQRGPQQQQPQQQRGPQQQQPQQQSGPQQQQPQQQRGPQQQQPQQQRGPQQQQPQQQRGPQQQQPQQQRGPQQQQPQQQRGPQQQQPQQQRGPQQQQPQQQRGPQQQQPQQQRGPQQQQPQQQRGPQQQPGSSAPQRGPPSQQQQQQHLGGGDTDLVQPKVKYQPGKEGRIIKIETNHLQLNLGKLKTAIHYDVDINPDTPKKLLPLVMEMFRQKYYKNRYPAFDGRKNLYASSMLFNGNEIEGEVEIMEDERKRPYKVKVQFANYVDLTPLQNMIDMETSPTEALQCVDIVLRSAPANYCIPVGRNFFIKPPSIIDLGEGMQMYHGFYQSAIRGWKPLLNVDVAHKAFPKEMSVVDALIEVCSTHYNRVRLEDRLHPNDQRTFERFMRTLKVIYEIPGNATSKRAYRCNGLGETAVQAQFNLDNGTRTTVQQYFERTKNCRLRYPHLPTLWVGSKQRQEKMLLPMELCKIVEGQAVQRKMTENQTSNMIRYSATNTDVRKQKIMGAIGQANYNQSPTVKEFNFSVGNTFEKLDARVLRPPSIQYSDGQVRVSRGVWRGDTNKYVKPQKIDKWTIACADRNCTTMEDLARMILSQGNRNGMQIAPPTKPFQLIGGRQTLSDIMQYLKQVSNYDIIFVVVPNSGPQYGYVKKAAELKVGCLTQCVKSNTMRKLNGQIVGNILLKVNSKMNGVNHHTVEKPLIMNRPCMIMGADVTHPGPDSTDIPSVAAVTASYDPKAFCYNICYRLQSPKLEIIEDLSAIVVEQLMFFYKKTNCRPERIVFFRDGVSEGQFNIVRNTEIRAIRNACSKMGDGNYQPKLTFLVVQKRHHTRMFPLNKNDSEDRNFNVPAGTCVDHTINNPFMQDFYLVSHASIQGVAKPTKYCTIWDENDFTYDQIQQLSYFLCHLFTRCNRSVSYPAPTYYAHLAAARAKVYIENENLNMNKLEEEQNKYNILEYIQKGKPMFFV